MNFWVQYVLVVIALTLADMCWTMYFIETSNKQAVRAGVWSSLIVLCSSYATVSFVDDKRFITAAIIGSFLGTYVTIKWVKKKDVRNTEEKKTKEIKKEVCDIEELKIAS